MVNVDILNKIFSINIVALFVLAIFIYFVFYILPQKIFPQEHIKNLSDKIMFNILYMLSYVLFIIPLLLELKIYSIPIFIISLLITKLMFIKYFYKQSLSIYIESTKVSIYCKVLDFVEFQSIIYEDKIEQIKEYINNFFNNITIVKLLKYIIFFTVFFYSAYLFAIRGLYTLSDALPDIAQFIEWVGFMSKGIFWADGKTFGADMYGQATLVFFLKSISNINSLIIFNIYPFFSVLFLLFGIYYVVYKITNSNYSALFSVLSFSMIFMSPINHIFTGILIKVASPEIINFFNLSIYNIPEIDIPRFEDRVSDFDLFWRHSSGLAYELASMMFLPYIYFFIKTLETNQNRYLVLYSLTLFLAFTFHGGSVVFLIPISILILFNSIIYQKLSLKLFKKGLLSILGASFLGNLWMFAMIKYGLPEDVGAAMPILDELLSTKQNTENIIEDDNTIELILHTDIQIIFIIVSILFLLYSFFSKKKFLLNSFAYVPIITMVIFFANNFGFPSLVFFQRGITYLLLSFSLISGIVFYAIFIKPIRFFTKKTYEKKIPYIFAFVLLLIILSTPKWHNKEIFWQKITDIEYAESSYIIYDIETNYQAFTWTIIADNQAYSKVLGKGFHVGTNTFIFNYDPRDEYLKIPTETIFIIQEHIANSYQGSGDWWLRWKNDMSDNIKEWICIYNSTHNNLETWYNGGDVIVYKIDNSKYIKKLNDIAKQKKRKERDD